MLEGPNESICFKSLLQELLDPSSIFSINLKIWYPQSAINTFRRAACADVGGWLLGRCWLMLVVHWVVLLLSGWLVMIGHSWLWLVGCGLVGCGIAHFVRQGFPLKMRGLWTRIDPILAPRKVFKWMEIETFEWNSYSFCYGGLCNKLYIYIYIIALYKPQNKQGNAPVLSCWGKSTKKSSRWGVEGLRPTCCRAFWFARSHVRSSLTVDDDKVFFPQRQVQCLKREMKWARAPALWIDFLPLKYFDFGFHSPCSHVEASCNGTVHRAAMFSLSLRDHQVEAVLAKLCLSWRSLKGWLTW